MNAREWAERVAMLMPDGAVVNKAAGGLVARPDLVKSLMPAGRALAAVDARLAEQERQLQELATKSWHDLDSLALPPFGGGDSGGSGNRTS